MNLQFLLLATAVALVNSETAQKCSDEFCKLPKCKCSTNRIPKNFNASETPQFVMLTFDDAITIKNIKYYTQLSKYKNPNGCPIGLTFFVTHDYNDYSLTYDMWKAGHEIATHSLSHRVNPVYWKNLTKQGWIDELAGMKKLLVKYGKIPWDDVQGVRAPFLQPGGNNQFGAMFDDDVELSWDCSMSTRNQVDLWPFSLEYRSTMECQIPPCPDESFPNTWVIPMLDLFYRPQPTEDNPNPGLEPCSMADACVVNSSNAVYDLLYRYFERNYKDGNRAPFGVYIHAAWFIDRDYGSKRFEGYKRFIQELLKKKDVYFITQSEVLNWISNPQKLSDFKVNSGKSCLSEMRKSDQRCNGRTDCILKVGSGKQYMKICGQSYDCPYKVIKPGGDI